MTFKPLALAIAAACLLVSGAQGAERKSRFAIPKPSELTAEQQAIVDNVMKIGRSGMDGPGNMYVRSPRVNAAQTQMGNYLNDTAQSGLTAAWRELTILVVAKFWSADYEWWVHASRAIKAGIPRAAVEDIKAGRAPRGLKPDEQVVFDLIHTLLNDRKVSETDYGRAKALLGEKGIVNLVAFAGSYGSTAMLLNVTDTKLPEVPADPLDSLYR